MNIVGTNKPSQIAVTENQTRDALSRVLSSDLFGHVDRLRNFLTYIVDEFVAGRGDLIRGKTIAMDVYGRDPTTSSQSENVVRVDARRLRRRLIEYYATVGKDDPIRIWVDKGGYVPRVEFHKIASPKASKPWPSKRLGTAVVLLAIGATATIFFGLRSSQITAKPDPLAMLKRQVLRKQSPTALQAVNLDVQARGLLFPLLKFEHQRIAKDMFRQVIHLDPDYFGGYAGLALTLATLSKLTPPGPARDEYLSEAVRMAEIAAQKNPPILGHNPQRPGLPLAFGITTGHLSFLAARQNSVRKTAAFLIFTV